MRVRLRWSCVLAGLFGLSAGVAAAEIPATQFTLGWGVDTEDPLQREISGILERYLTSSDSSVRDAGTMLWCEADQLARHQFDLTEPWVYKGVQATLLEITPTSTDSTGYWVRTLYAFSDHNGIQPFGLQRLLARRDRGTWVLCGALGSMTSGWNRQVVGEIAYHYPDTWNFDRGKAEIAAAFVGRIAADFGLTEREPIDYYLAPTPEALARILGLDWTIPGVRGRTYAPDRLVFVGDATQGEAYLHELVHVVLSPLAPAGDSPLLISEGVASWLGGSRGLDFAGLMEELLRYQSERPAVNFADIVDPTRHRSEVGYHTGALLMECLYRKGGTEAVKRAVQTVDSDGALYTLLERELGVEPAAATQWWRSSTRMLVEEAK